MTKQCRQMIEYLMEHNTITGIEALHNLGIISYTKTISVLRDMGFIITDVYKIRRSKFGRKRYKEYTLEKVSPKLRKLLK